MAYGLYLLKNLVMPVYDMEEGMHYQCQRCTKCCQWPGEVVLSDRDIDRIAGFLGVSAYEFVAKYKAISDRKISEPNLLPLK